jgi:microcompartment protein CcmL/EutN
MDALGLIETVGLTAAIKAADAAVKSANVALVGFEQTKGGGLTVVKFTGDVGAIKSAVAAAVAVSVGNVYSTKIIAHPSCGVASMFLALPPSTPPTESNKRQEEPLIQQDEPTVLQNTASTDLLAANEPHEVGLSSEPQISAIQHGEEQNGVKTERMKQVTEESLSVESSDTTENPHGSEEMEPDKKVVETAETTAKEIEPDAKGAETKKTSGSRKRMG